MTHVTHSDLLTHLTRDPLTHCHLWCCTQVCASTSRLYVADVQSVWSVRVPNAWARQHVHDVRPISLSVTHSRLLVTCRSGHRLMLFDVDGKLLRRVRISYKLLRCISTATHISQIVFVRWVPKSNPI